MLCSPGCDHTPTREACQHNMFAEAMGDIDDCIGIFCKLNSSEPPLLCGHTILETVIRHGRDKNVISQRIECFTQNLELLGAVAIAVCKDDRMIDFPVMGQKLGVAVRVQICAMPGMNGFDAPERLVITSHRAGMRN